MFLRRVFFRVFLFIIPAFSFAGMKRLPPIKIEKPPQMQIGGVNFEVDFSKNTSLFLQNPHYKEYDKLIAGTDKLNKSYEKLDRIFQTIGLTTDIVEGFPVNFATVLKEFNMIGISQDEQEFVLVNDGWLLKVFTWEVAAEPYNLIVATLYQYEKIASYGQSSVWFNEVAVLEANDQGLRNIVKSNKTPSINSDTDKFLKVRIKIYRTDANDTYLSFDGSTIIIEDEIHISSLQAARDAAGIGHYFDEKKQIAVTGTNSDLARLVLTLMDLDLYEIEFPKKP